MFRSLPAVLVLLAALVVGVQAQAACTVAHTTESTLTSAFTPNEAAGTVTHALTGLTWKKCAQGKSGATCVLDGTIRQMTWSAALAAAAADTTDGGGWRLPNKKELESIVEWCRKSPAINTDVFSNSDATGTYWSASSNVPTPSGAWNVSAFSGASGSNLKTLEYYVRLVRGGQPGAPTIGTATAGNGNASASITFTAPSSDGYSAITGYTATSSPGGFTGSCAASPCTVTGLSNGTTYTFTVTATNGVGTGPASAASNSVTPVATQTVTFAPSSPVIYGVAPMTLTASTTSGLTAFTFGTSSASSICTVSGSTLNIAGVGTCVLTATQAGNATYASAWANASVVINAASQSITFTDPGTQTFGTTPTLSATASSGLTPAFTSTTTGVCTISSAGVLTFVTTGTCTINANQAGNGSYSAAPQVTHSFNVGKASQAALTAASTSTTPILGSTTTLSSTGGSGIGEVSFSSSNGNCTISGATLTAAAVGSCTVTATKAADAHYTAATATVNITISTANGACGVIAATAFVPTSGLCTQGTASTVTHGSPWAWTCTGTGTGHTDASCTAPNQSTATGTGPGRALIAATNSWVIDTANSAGFVPAPTSFGLPPGVSAFKHGLFDVRLITGAAGSSTTITITYPEALPAGTVYWKYGPTASEPAPHWYPYDASKAVISPDRMSITLTLTDNADGDDAYTTDSVIEDPGAPASPADAPTVAASIPTLSDWALIILSALLGLGFMVVMSRQRSPR